MRVSIRAWLATRYLATDSAYNWPVPPKIAIKTKSIPSENRVILLNRFLRIVNRNRLQRLSLSLSAQRRDYDAISAARILGACPRIDQSTAGALAMIAIFEQAPSLCTDHTD